MAKGKAEAYTLKEILDRFPDQDTIDALTPDGGKLGYRKYPITASDEEIIVARAEFAQLLEFKAMYEGRLEEPQKTTVHTMCSADIGKTNPIRFICGHGDFADPCKICQGTGHNAVFDMKK